MRKILNLLIVCFTSISIQAQNIYWQQKVDHDINVKLDTTRKMLLGFETITYHNNSPQALEKIYFHLWPNAYSSHETALGKQLNRQNDAKFYFSTDAKKGFIDSLDFKVNGTSVALVMDENHPDIASIDLPEPLKSGDKINITTSFRSKIPDCRFSRFGQCGNSYQITQWYPKPATYDQNGWNTMPYLQFGEFYNEFGAYKVNITIPKAFGIGATGRKVSGNHLPENTGEEVYKTLTFEQDSITDFAWFCDTEFKHLTESHMIPKTNKSFNAEVFYRNQSKGVWNEAPSFIRDAVFAYSKWVGPYPFAHATAVDGAITAGAGMEYPMITVIADSENKQSFDRVIAHEVGHNWFQGILASNERMFPYMDEGLNSFYDSRYMRERYPDADLSMPGLGPLNKIFRLNKISQHDQYSFFYAMQARLNKDVPCNLPAERYSMINGGVIVYGKTALALRNLYGWMGEERFDKAMQAYYEAWKFKHPQPDDFRKSITQNAGQDLNWFFDDLLQTRKKTDYAIRKVSSKADEQFIIVKNKGGVAAPFPVTGIKGDSTITFWFDGFEGKQKLSFPTNDFDNFIIDKEFYTLDINRKNNFYDKTKLFPKKAVTKFQFLTGFEMPGEHAHYYTPALGWNTYNGFMLGMKFHNISITERAFEYNVTPLYSFKKGDLAGMAHLNYNIKPLKGPFQKIVVGVEGATFATGETSAFRKIAPYISFVPFKKNDDSPLSHEIRLRSVNINRDNLNTLDLLATEINSGLQVQQVSWSLKNTRAVHPFNLNTVLEQSQTFVKAQTTFNYRISYISKKKGLDIRVFAGTFLWTNPDISQVPDVRFRLSGQNGRQDYLYDGIYLGRFENTGLWSQQFTETDGGFKEFSFRGQTYDYLAAINLKASLPGKIPIRLYADIGNYKNGETDRDLIAYGAGVMLNVVSNQFEVYFPMLVSPAIKGTLETNNVKYAERIRFTLNLHNINLFKTLKNINL
jgi:hypothetical protein